MAGLAPTGMTAVVVQGIGGAAGGAVVVATHILHDTLVILPLQVPWAGVPRTPAPDGQVHIPTPVVEQVALDVIVVTGVDEPPEQYETQALSVPSLINGCSRSEGVR